MKSKFPNHDADAVSLADECIFVRCCNFLCKNTDTNLPKIE